MHTQRHQHRYSSRVSSIRTPPPPKTLALRHGLRKALTLTSLLLARIRHPDKLPLGLHCSSTVHPVEQHLRIGHLRQHPAAERTTLPNRLSRRLALLRLCLVEHLQLWALNAILSTHVSSHVKVLLMIRMHSKFGMVGAPHGAARR